MYVLHLQHTPLVTAVLLKMLKSALPDSFAHLFAGLLVGLSVLTLVSEVALYQLAHVSRQLCFPTLRYRH